MPYLAAAVLASWLFHFHEVAMMNTQRNACGCGVGLRLLVGFALGLTGGVVSERACAQDGPRCGVMLQDTVLPSDGFGHRSIYRWDFDGDGPMPEEVLVGTERGRVLAYDGTEWRQVGGRMGSTLWGDTITDPIVLDFVTFRDELYAVVAGSLSNTAGGLFRFDGAGWVAVPQNPPASSCNGLVTGWMAGATIYQGKILVVGSNLRCGATPTLALTWDGSRWAPLGNLAASGISNAVCGAAFVTSDGSLLVGGTISASTGQHLIMRYNDGVWVPELNGSAGIGPPPVSRFQEIDGRLYALTNSVLLNAQQQRAALLEYNFTSLRWEVRYPITGAALLLDAASRIVTVGDRWFMAGSLNNEEGVVLTRTGEGPWSKLPITGARIARLRDIAEVSGRLIAVGVNTSNSTCASFATAVTGPSDGSSLTLEPSRFASAPVQAQNLGRLAVTSGGIFVYSGPENSNNLISTAGPGSVNTCTKLQGSLARRFERDWVAAANNITFQAFNGQVRSIIDYEGQTYAFGPFTRVGETTISAGVARWTGTTWESGLAPLSNTVASAVVSDGELYVSEASTVSTTTVKRWTGSAWQVVGAPLSASGARLVDVRGTLYAYVLFSTAVFTYDGAAWVRLPDYFTQSTSISDATEHNGDLVVTSGSSGRQNVARWDVQSGAWVALPAFGGNVGIRSLASHDGMLYAGSSYGSGGSGSPLYRLRGEVWELAAGNAPPRPGVPHPQTFINDMVSVGEYLHLVGNISYIDGVTAEGYAVFYTGAPTFVVQPQDAVNSECSGAVFSARVREANDVDVTYRWLRNGEPLTDGDGVRGSSTPILTVAYDSAVRDGEFVLEVSNGCNITLSTPAALTQGCGCVPCTADFNDDGGIDGADVELYFSRWSAGDCRADLSGDGGIDGTDIDVFFALWVGGGC
jgi:hypothetical protein